MFLVQKRTKDKMYLPESGKLCWWTNSRRRLPVAKENRMREHPSDTKVLTMKMEILLEPTSNKLLEILLKMNLPDHRIKQRWRWRHLVPVESIHHPMLTLNAFKKRHHDN
ncbi:hypothetical protein Tco_0287018 [Tanacetum coccineum]